MKTILDAIGNTPLINIEGIWVKMEFMNPSGSIKARIAKYMIERAEAEGLLKPGDTIVEASSGNTGNAMSMVAAVKGYKMLVIMPDGMSPERTAISEAFGAEVHTMGDFHVNDALEEARRRGAMPGFFAPQQFDNDWNVDENREWLGQEILQQIGLSTGQTELCPYPTSLPAQHRPIGRLSQSPISPFQLAPLFCSEVQSLSHPWVRCPIRKLYIKPNQPQLIQFQLEHKNILQTDY